MITTTIQAPTESFVRVINMNPAVALKRRCISPRELRLVLVGIFGLVATGAALATLLVHIFLLKEPFAIPDSIKGIRLTLRQVDKGVKDSKVLSKETSQMASQIKLVSDIIARTNNAVNRKDLALSIVSESIRANIDPLLITAVVKSESTFKSSAISTKGARGLMQLLPTTAEFTAHKITRSGRAETHALHRVDYNLKLGIAYLKHLQKIFSGNKELALMAYNWGPGNVINAIKNKEEIPTETRQYARKIISNHNKWKRELVISNEAGNIIS